MSQSLAVFLAARLAAARDLAAYISQPDRAVPKETQEIDRELTLRWVLVEYWHMAGTYRSRYLKASLSEQEHSVQDDDRNIFHGPVHRGSGLLA